MTKRTRRTHSAAFKAKVALAALGGDKTLAELGFSAIVSTLALFIIGSFFISFTQ